jgi:hypothetical protein
MRAIRWQVELPAGIKARLRRVVAASDRTLRLAVLSNQNVRVDGGYDVFGETPKTARGTRALPISNCVVRALGGPGTA